MRFFWDRRAEEDAFYFVDNRLRYRQPDVERFWAGGEEDLARLLGALGVDLRPTDAVIEIGCGVGRLTRAIAARSGSVRAIDVSSRMLGLARAYHPDLENVTWLQGDGVSLAEIADDSADACISHVVFQHIPNAAITLGYVAEMGRVLRPGGWAAFQVSNDPSVHRPRAGAARLMTTALSLVGRAPRGQGDPAWLGSAVDLGELRDTAVRAQLEVERVVGEGTQFCFVLARRRAS
jgi:SAM-dependent methyltransferase